MFSAAAEKLYPAAAIRVVKVLLLEPICEKKLCVAMSLEWPLAARSNTLFQFSGPVPR